MQYPYPSFHYIMLMALLTNEIAYSQCREQVDGSWAPDSSWQCQQPGGAGTTPSPSTPSSSDVTSSGSGAGTVATASTNSDSSDTSSDGSSSQAATTGDCTSTSAPGGWEGVASTSVNIAC